MPAYDASAGNVSPACIFRGGIPPRQARNGRRRMDFGIVELSRLQFAMTALYHFLFVPLTLG
ncbi:cytochrome ubiquinol oxidase subunit I, partial [Paenirhodobacter hankyongi]|uniref:cytochrome ubiquinol oxidase subunit I n=1 Tax=Paenirhodobacter hankyongi TaxID=2294033 RepID=UPI001FEB3D42